MHDLHDRGMSYRSLALVAAGMTLAVLGSFAGPRCVVAEPFSARQAGQDTPVAAGTEAAQEPPQVTPIPLEEVGQRAVDAAAAANRAIAVATPVETVDEIETDLTAQEAAFSEREQIAVILSGAPPLRWLDDQTAMWRGRGVEADRWGAQLDARIQELGEAAADLEQQQTLWQLTDREHRGRPDSAGVVKAIEQVVSELRDADAVVQGRLQAVFEVRGRVTLTQDLIREILIELSAATTAARQRLFTRDAAPFWRAASASSLEEIRRDAVEAWEYRRDTIARFIAASPRALAAHGFFLLMVLGSALALRRRSRGWPSDDRVLQAAAQIVSRPVSTAILIAVIFTERFYVTTPVPFVDLMIFASLIPLVRLLPGLMPPAKRPLFYGLVGLVALNQLWSLMPEAALARRALVLVATGLGFGGALYAYRNSLGGFAGSLERFRTFVRRVIGLAALLLFLGIIANLLGWTRLAELLVDGIVFSIYTGGAYVVVLLFVRGIAETIPDSIIGRTVHSIGRHAEQFTRRFTMVALVVAGLWWAVTVLDAFRLAEPLYAGGRAFLNDPRQLGTIEFTVRRVVNSVLILALIPLVSRLARLVLNEDVFPRLKTAIGEAQAIDALVHYLIVFIGVIMAAGSLGLEATQLTVVGGALGFGIGFGLQDVFKNFTAGLILSFERPIKVGDTIEVGPDIGTVQRIGIRSSTFVTLEGAEVVVPNSELVSKTVINWTLSNQARRLEVMVGVGYESDPRQVVEILTKISTQHPDVMQAPEPKAVLLSFGKTAMEFAIRAWADVKDLERVHSELQIALREALVAAGVEIYPHRASKTVPADPARK